MFKKKQDTFFFISEVLYAVLWEGPPSSCLFKFKLILFCLVFVFPLSFWCDFPVKDFAWYQVMLEFNVSKCTLCFRGVNFWWLLWCEALLSCVVVWFLAWCMVSRLFPWRKWVSGIETKISGLSRESGIGLHLLSLQILVSEAIFIWFVFCRSNLFNSSLTKANSKQNL